MSNKETNSKFNPLECDSTYFGALTGPTAVIRAFQLANYSPYLLRTKLQPSGSTQSFSFTANVQKVHHHL